MLLSPNNTQIAMGITLYIALYDTTVIKLIFKTLLIIVQPANDNVLYFLSKMEDPTCSDKDLNVLFFSETRSYSTPYLKVPGQEIVPGRDWN